jgi:hypothetical protein
MTSAPAIPSPVTVSVPPPVGWFDKTMIVHAAPLGPGETMAANIVVSRDACAAGESFPAYCQRQRDTFTGSLPGCGLHGQQQGQIGGRAAERIELEWAATPGWLRQMVTFIDAGQGIVVSFAASAPSSSFEAYRALFEESLSRLQITEASL